MGLAIAWGAVRLLVAVAPATLPRLHELRLDGIAVAFTFGLTLLVALVFGVMPLLYGTPLAASLHESGRGNTASRSRHRARRLLMGGQIALALVLLVASGLLVRSSQRPEKHGALRNDGDGVTNAVRPAETPDVFDDCADLLGR